MRTYLLRTFLVPILITFTGSGFAQENPDQLLDSYLEYGTFEYSEKIRDDFKDTPHAKFCDAWEYIGANNEISKELAGTLVQDHPAFAPGYLALGTVLSSGYNDYDEAIKQFDKGIEIDPGIALAYLNRGIAKIGSGDNEGAIEDFDRVMKIKRGHAPAFLLRGIAHYNMGNEGSMKADFEIGLQLDYQALSTIPSDLAENAINKAIESAQDNAIYYYSRGYSAFSNGNYRSARADFTRCIELVPGSSDFYKYSGASKMHLEDFEGGQKDLNYALSVNPDDPEIYYFLGVLMNDFLKQPAMAQEYMNTAIGLDDSQASYYYERSKAAFKMLKFQEARDDVNRALQKDHTKGDFYALRGNIKMKTGRPVDDYCPDFRKARDWGTAYNLKRILRKTCK
jgi:tetratricopeptide (TPR) repeat protein